MYLHVVSHCLVHRWDDGVDLSFQNGESSMDSLNAQEEDVTTERKPKRAKNLSRLDTRSEWSRVNSLIRTDCKAQTLCVCATKYVFAGASFFEDQQPHVILWYHLRRTEPADIIHIMSEGVHRLHLNQDRELYHLSESTEDIIALK